jgi:hypothetical protein
MVLVCMCVKKKVLNNNSYYVIQYNYLYFCGNISVFQ